MPNNCVLPKTSTATEPTAGLSHAPVGRLQSALAQQICKLKESTIAPMEHAHETREILSGADRGMDAIIISANTELVDVDDAIKHLADHKDLYWEVGFPIKDKFSFPMSCFLHITDGQVEYRATVRDIIPFSPTHYKDPVLAPQVKPEAWRKSRGPNDPNLEHDWKHALVMMEIVPFSYDTRSFVKYRDGRKVQRPPQGYVRVFPPGHVPSLENPPERPGGRRQVGTDASLLEGNVEEFIIQRLGAIEHGLRLVGRLDLLCEDATGNYVVVEIKRTQGTDQVVGQISRYMGWLMESYPKKKVRGIIIVGKKDEALRYAAMAVPNVQVKEFEVQIC